jgi:hypothetical protein
VWEYWEICRVGSSAEDEMGKTAKEIQTNRVRKKSRSVAGERRRAGQHNLQRREFKTVCSRDYSSQTDTEQDQLSSCA